MKPIIIISFILFLFQGSIVSGQTIAFADYPVTDYTHFNDNSVAHHRRHSVTTRIGEGVMIGAGVFIVMGGAYSLITTDSGDLGGAVLLVGGQFLAGIGGIVFGCGRHYEKRHKTKFGIVSKGNRIGLAYNID